MPKSWQKCNNGSCALIADRGDGTYAFTSTVDGNEGSVVYTAAEVATLLDGVKAGEFDTLHADARSQAGAVTA